MLKEIKEPIRNIKNKIRQRMDDTRKIALFIDGPNMLRREFNLNLSEIKKKLETHGKIKISTVFLNQFAPEKLVEAMVNQGLDVKIVISDDVDAPLATEAMEAIFNPHIHSIALMTRDGDFQSILLKAKKYGKETIIIGSEPLSSALKNTADHTIKIE